MIHCAGTDPASTAARGAARQIRSTSAQPTSGPLAAADLVTGEETAILLNLHRVGFDAGEPKGNPRKAYCETRGVHSKMAATEGTSPVALVVASAALGSFEATEGDDGSTAAKIARVSFGQSLAGIGAGIDSLIGGPAGGVLGGGVLGGAVGGLLGGMVDDKLGKK